MKCAIDLLSFRRALHGMKKIKPCAYGHSALGCCLIDATDDGIRATVGNLGDDIWLTTELEGEVIEPGKAVASFKKIEPTIRRLKQLGGEVTVEANPDNVYGLTIKHELFEGSIYTEVHPDDFPGRPERPETWSEVAGQQFVDALEVAYRYASSDDARPNLTGVCFAREGDHLSMIATDGHRLTKRATGIDVAGVEWLDEQRIIPRKACRILTYLAGKRWIDAASIRVASDGEYFWAEIGPHTLCVKMIGGTFPDYLQLLRPPKEGDPEFVVDAEVFMQVIRLASPFASKTGDICLHLDREAGATVTATCGDGKCKIDLPAEIEGKPVKIGFNWKYLRDVVNHTDAERIRARLVDDLSPARFEGADGDGESFIIVMPMRI